VVRGVNNTKEVWMIRGIFFDLYGTLFIYGDMKKAWADWLHHFFMSLKEHGLTLTKGEFSKECERFFDRAEPAITDQNLTLFEKRVKYMCISHQINISDKDISSIADLIVEVWQREIVLDPTTVGVLQKLKKKMKLCLVSNFDHPRNVHKYLSLYGIDGLFDNITISGEVGIKKPDPEIFEQSLSATGLSPHEVAYVGDSDEDIQAAIAAGMLPILIERLDNSTDSTTPDIEDAPQIYSVKKIDQIHGKFQTISSLGELLSFI
jgi:putative hydrolase of the HAD superfamily